MSYPMDIGVKWPGREAPSSAQLKNA